MTHATDCPTIDKKSEGEVALGKGPVIYRGPNMNPRVVDRLMETADGRRRALSGRRQRPGHADRRQHDPDQPRRRGRRRWSAFPNRYMHSPVEMVSLDDIDRAADLLAGFALRLTGDEKFIP